MATYDFSLTRDQIIAGALRTLGILGEGQTPSAQQYTDCAEALNLLLKSWQAKGVPIWAIKQQAFPVTATASYVMGPSLTVDMQKPLKIYQAWMRDTTSNVDTPMYPLTQQQYNVLGNKSSTGSPTQYYVEILKDQANFYLFPVPDSATISAKQCYVLYQAPFADFDASTDTPDVPQEGLLALQFALAGQLVYEFRVPRDVRLEIQAKAERYVEEFFDFVQEEGSIFFQVDRTRM